MIPGAQEHLEGLHQENLEGSAPPSEPLSPEMPMVPREEGKGIWEMDWGWEYLRCPKWGLTYQQVQSSPRDWPAKLKVIQGRLYSHEMLCVPYHLQEKMIFEHHGF